MTKPPQDCEKFSAIEDCQRISQQKFFDGKDVYIERLSAKAILYIYRKDAEARLF